MRTPRWLLVGVLLAGLALGAAASAVGAAGGGLPGGPPGEPTGVDVQAPSPFVPEAHDQDPDRVVLRALVHENGTATWTVEYRVRLDDDADEAAFQELADNISANRTWYERRFTRRMRGTAARAANATGRSMVVENASVRTTRRSVPQSYGVVVYRFRWHGFAATGETVRVGDALGGLFLDAETTLILAWPESLQPKRVAPTPAANRTRAAVWRGPEEFPGGGPRVILAPTDGSLEGRRNALPARTGVDDRLVVLGLAAALVVAGVLVKRTAPRVLGRGREDEASTAPGSAAESGGVGGGSAESAGDVPGRGAQPDASEQAAAGPVPEADADEAPADLLSNEEQVLRELDQCGGRAKQQDLVDALEWSETKTSDVVQALRDDDAVEVYRLGRENVVALPGESGFDVGGDHRDG